MAKPQPLQEKFTGMWRDSARNQLPKGKVYDMVDFIPDLEAPAGKRGGFSYEGSALTTLNASAGFPRFVAVAPFLSEGGTAATLVDQVLAIDDSLNRLFDVTNSVDRGAAQNCHQTPIYYARLLIIGGTGTVAPMKYAGSAAPAALAGSPPNSAIFAVYKNRLLAADYSKAATIATPGRVFFSAAGNPESWDTTNRWIDTSAMVVGMAALRNSILVFHAGSVERIRGDIPPGSSAANMVLEPLFDNVGLFEPNSYATDGDSVVWADEDGVYQSDGASISDLTKQGGIKRFWQTNFTWSTVASLGVGVWRGYVVISVLGPGVTNQGFMVCHLESRSWFRFGNIAAKNFANRSGAVDEFYFANQFAKQIGELSTVFAPAATVKNDADGGAVSPSLGLPNYTIANPGKKQVKNLYVTYDMRDAASDNPILTAYYGVGAFDVVDGALSPDLAETTTLARKRVPVRRAGNGIHFTLTQTNASSLTRIYSVEADLHPLEGSRR